MYLSSDVFPTPLRFEPIPKGHMLALLTRTHLEVVIEWNHPPKWSNWNDWRMALLWVNSIPVSLKKRKETCYKHTHIWISSWSENKHKKTLDVSKTHGILSIHCKGLKTLRIPGMHHPGGRNGKVLPKLCCCGHRRLSAKRQVFFKWALQMLKSWDNSSENRSCSTV